MVLAQLGYVLGAELTVPDSLGFLGGSTLYVGYVNGNDDGNWKHTPLQMTRPRRM